MKEAEATELVCELFDTWYPALVRYAMRGAGSLQAAEDIAQEIFLKLYRELRSGSDIENPKGWTLTLARHEIGKLAARRYREDTALFRGADLDAFPAVGDPLITALEYDSVTKLFSVLSSREEEALMLRVAGMKYREIAERMGISSSSVNTLLARGLRKLQRAALRPERERVQESAEESVSKPLQ